MIFICDVMLGKLARYLRMLGLDAPYIRMGEPAVPPPGKGQHCFFTKGAAKKGHPGAILVHSNDPQEQVLEIKEYIKPHIDPSVIMTRCVECNVYLVEAKKEDIEPLVPEYIYHHHDTFKVCPSCRRVYWEGSHADEMKIWIRKVMGDG
jgi:uncharacterized protein